eukprot:m.224083 g.224083  ORF g.224083 m.224083 type:complete len:86 (+) comp15947_c1_seq32:43-300(+)
MHVYQVVGFIKAIGNSTCGSTTTTGTDVCIPQNPNGTISRVLESVNATWAPYPAWIPLPRKCSFCGGISEGATGYGIKSAMNAIT